jgi:DNA excision repair protein ERCC-2
VSHAISLYFQNVLNPDVVNEAVPGNIRRAEHFIGFMKKVVEHLKARLRSVAGPNGGVRSETPLAFLHRMTNGTSLEAKPLRFAYSRLSSLLRTLQVSKLEEFNALTDVADFASLLATYSEGVAKFAIIMEPNGSSIPGASDPVIQLVCLDSSLAIAPLFKRFSSVILTSGTLSPIDLYPKLLQFEPCVSEAFSMSTFRPCIRPMVITRGSDQLAVSTKYEDRGDMGVIRNYGAMLVELCGAIPDGVVAFFTSYSYMESIISEWDAIGILRELTKHKLVFIETKDVVETTLALDNYRRACDCGRGAVFLSVARGKVSEGINFDRHYGRAVVRLSLVLVAIYLFVFFLIMPLGCFSLVLTTVPFQNFRSCSVSPFSTPCHTYSAPGLNICKRIIRSENKIFSTLTLFGRHRNVLDVLFEARQTTG